MSHCLSFEKRLFFQRTLLVEVDQSSGSEDHHSRPPAAWLLNQSREQRGFFYSVSTRERGYDIGFNSDDSLTFFIMTRVLRLFS